MPDAQFHLDLDTPQARIIQGDATDRPDQMDAIGLKTP